MKIQFILCVSISIILLCTFSSSQAQIYTGGNGLTVSGTGTTTKVELGGALTKNTSIDLGASFQFGFTKGSVNYLNLLNNGYIGIGTAAPQGPLHILNNTNVQSILLESNSTGWGSGLILKNTASGAGRSYGIYSSAFGSFHIVDNTAGQNRIYINNAGSVGIGADVPMSRLHVYGRIRSENNEDNGGIGGALILTHPGKVANGIAKEWVVYNMGGSYGNSLQFWAYDNVGCGTGLCANKFTIMDNGNVGIGLTNPVYKLAVAGTIAGRKVKVTQETWADYVFDPNYPLPSLKEVENYIKSNKHLPGVPSAGDVEKNGLDLGDNQATLLKKIEELTLYLLEQNKKLVSQQERISQLEEKIKKLTSR